MRWCLALLLAVEAACGSPQAQPECVTVETSCAPLYPPTFDNVYATTLAAKCGSDRVACHSNAGMKGGMSFQDLDTAYASLLAAGEDRVIPGDPACSEMIIRVSATGSAQMPPGVDLSPEERCALVQWISAGALPAAGQAADASVRP
jgi:hypothetical protein